MKNEKKSEIKVGLISIIGIITMLLVLGWAKDIDVFGTKRILKVSFDNVAGLEIGDAVMINGVKSGKVETIQPGKEGVEVSMNINQDAVIYSNAEYNIMMLDLMGGKKVEIYPGTEGDLDLSVIYSGSFRGDISTAMSALSKVEKDLVDMIGDLKITLHETNKLLTDEEFFTNLKESVNQLSDLTKSVNRLVSDNRSGIDSLITNSNNLISTTNKFVSDNENDIAGFIQNTNNLVVRADEFIKKLNSFISNMENRENNLGKLVYDPDLFENLKKTMKQVDELLNLMVEQLKNDGLKVDADVDLF